MLNGDWKGLKAMKVIPGCGERILPYIVNPYGVSLRLFNSFFIAFLF